MTMGTWRGRRDDDNGMHITGSSNQVNTGRIGGDQRQIHISGTSSEAAHHLATAQAKLAEITIALNEHEDELSNPNLARRTAARIGEELDSPNPDQRRLTENLEDLGLAVGAVASVVTILQALTTAVGALHG
ncbi:hypothetical protein [Streptomyces sp. NBC_00118]|uniref:hypothetical protein n=1 Tax=Streptomyces sp. NBC_00118 TaxID=2975658 RepID=UPI003090AF62|nr:hypothetical protein OG518_36130 [Streptomyces sp. NBC_01397]